MKTPSSRHSGRQRRRTRTSGSEPEKDAFLGILRTADLLQSELNQLLKAEDLSHPLYNVLRILRGAGAEGLPCSEISARLVTRDPDVTRLVDRLEKRRLVRRARNPDDRRVVRVRITEAGLEMLAGLDRPVADLHVKQLGHLGPDRLHRLTSILEAARRRA